MSNFDPYSELEMVNPWVTLIYQILKRWGKSKKLKKKKENRFQLWHNEKLKPNLWKQT